LEISWYFELLFDRFVNKKLLKISVSSWAERFMGLPSLPENFHAFQVIQEEISERAHTMVTFSGWGIQTLWVTDYNVNL